MCTECGLENEKKIYQGKQFRLSVFSYYDYFDAFIKQLWNMERGVLSHTKT